MAAQRRPRGPYSVVRLYKSGRKSQVITTGSTRLEAKSYALLLRQVQREFSNRRSYTYRIKERREKAAAKSKRKRTRSA